MEAASKVRVKRFFSYCWSVQADFGMVSAAIFFLQNEKNQFVLDLAKKFVKQQLSDKTSVLIAAAVSKSNFPIIFYDFNA